MGYIDCYMEGDLEGHPSTTYMIDVNDPMVKQALIMLKRHYDKVELVEKTEGQSPIKLSEFVIANIDTDSLPTLQEAVKNIQSESVAHTILA